MTRSIKARLLTRVKKLRATVLVLLFACYAVNIHAASLTSTVDRNQLSANETLTLTVNYDGGVDASLLDYSALQKDFEIIGVTPQSNSSISIANGRASRVSKTAWSIILAPKREGQLVIPAFSINNENSQAITINVDSSTQNATGSPQPLQAWTIASGDAVYPNQQLIVTIEISAQNDVGNLNGPELIVKDAQVESLGQQSFQRVENGVARQTVQLTYAVSAETAGEIVIPRMTYTAVKGGQRGFFGARGQKVTARTEQLTIKVKALPSNAPAPWFPAEDVQIRSEWSGDTSAIKVGEPITRTITITADGQQAETISPLSKPNSVDGIKAYKDQPQLHTQTTESGFVGTRIESSAIVASQAGTVVLPELRLSWWNVKTDRLEQAILPAETIVATGAAAIVPKVTPSTEIVTPEPTYTADSNLVRVLIAGVIALLLLCLTQFWVILRLRKSMLAQSWNPPSEKRSNLSETDAWRALQKALSSAQTAEVRRTLILWGKAISPNGAITNLQDLANFSNDQEIKQQLSLLEKSLYKDNTQFDVAELKATLMKFRRGIIKPENKSKADARALQPLYANISG